MIYFIDLPLCNDIVITTAKAIPTRSDPIVKPQKQALHLGELIIARKRLKE